MVRRRYTLSDHLRSLALALLIVVGLAILYAKTNEKLIEAPHEDATRARPHETACIIDGYNGQLDVNGRCVSGGGR